MDAHGHHVDVFRSEYHELYDAAVGSIEGAGTAGRKVEQLGQLLASHRDKLSTMETYEDDAKSTRLNLSVTLETMRTHVKDIKEREDQRRAAAKTYYSDIEALKTELARGPGWTEQQEELRKTLLSEAGNLQRQLELRQRDHEALRGDCDKLTGMLEVEEAKIVKLSDALTEVDTHRTDLREASRKEVVRKAKHEEELLVRQDAMRKGQHVHREKQALLKSETATITALEQQLRDSKESIEEYLTQYDALFRSIQKLGDELEQQITANTALETENAAKLQAAHDRAAAAAAVKQESDKLSKLRELAAVKIEATEAERQVLEEQRDALRAEIYRINSVDLKGERRKCEALQRQLGDLQREKDILERKYASSDKAANLMFDLTKVNQNAHKNLADEINTFKASIREKRHTIDQLVAERQRHEAEADSYRSKYADRVEELKLQEFEVGDLQQKIVSSAARLKQQQNLYEAVRSDRNVYSKNLIETQDMIKEMKRRFKIMNHQIEQLKEEITLKDHSLVKEHFHHHNADKEKETLKNEVTKIRKQIVGSENIVVNQCSEVQKLGQIIQEADDERLRQVKEHDAIISERTILNRQLTKRSEELSQLYAKIQLQTSALHQGEVRYQTLRSQIQGPHGLQQQVYTILYTILYTSTSLCYILYYAMLCYTILCIMLYYTILYYTILYTVLCHRTYKFVILTLSLPLTGS
jgi:chromosome segregation ATPase